MNSEEKIIYGTLTGSAFFLGMMYGAIIYSNHLLRISREEFGREIERWGRPIENLVLDESSQIIMVLSLAALTIGSGLVGAGSNKKKALEGSLLYGLSSLGSTIIGAYIGQSETINSLINYFN